MATKVKPPWFGLPQGVISERIWAKLRRSEMALYGVLLYKSQRRSNLEFPAKNEELTYLSGVSATRIRHARTKLEEYGVIRSRRGEGNQYIYTICNAPFGSDQTQQTPKTCEVQGVPLDFSDG